MNIEQAKEFCKKRNEYPPDHLFDLIADFAHQAVTAERSRIRAGIEALRIGKDEGWLVYDERCKTLDAALAVVDGDQDHKA